MSSELYHLICATLTTEAGLRAWYVTIKQTHDEDKAKHMLRIMLDSDEFWPLEDQNQTSIRAVFVKGAPDTAIYVFASISYRHAS